MANGDDVEYEFEGNADCPICGALVGTIDDRPIPQPHENCQCSSIPKCNNTYHYSGTSDRYGPGGDCFIFNAEVEVTCWDGQTIGVSVPIDFGCVGADYEDDFWEQVWDLTGDEAAGLADGCPDCDPPLVA